MNPPTETPVFFESIDAIVEDYLDRRGRTFSPLMWSEETKVKMVKVLGDRYNLWHVDNPLTETIGCNLNITRDGKISDERFPPNVGAEVVKRVLAAYGEGMDDEDEARVGGL